MARNGKDDKGPAKTAGGVAATPKAGTPGKGKKGAGGKPKGKPAAAAAPAGHIVDLQQLQRKGAHRSGPGSPLQAPPRPGWLPDMEGPRWRHPLDGPPMPPVWLRPPHEHWLEVSDGWGPMEDMYERGPGRPPFDHGLLPSFADGPMRPDGGFSEGGFPPRGPWEDPHYPADDRQLLQLLQMQHQFGGSAPPERLPLSPHHHQHFSRHGFSAPLHEPRAPSPYGGMVEPQGPSHAQGVQHLVRLVQQQKLDRDVIEELLFQQQHGGFHAQEEFFSPPQVQGPGRGMNSWQPQGPPWVPGEVALYGPAEKKEVVVSPRAVHEFPDGQQSPSPPAGMYDRGLWRPLEAAIPAKVAAGGGRGSVLGSKPEQGADLPSQDEMDFFLQSVQCTG